MRKKINIIGSGFSSLAAASYLAKAGHQVSVFEKNKTVGGRARQLKKDGFTFDIGPSWYWMPGEVIEFCDPRIQSIKQTIEEVFDIEIQNHSLYFYGIQKKKKSK